jgi:hypothetical protein
VPSFFLVFNVMDFLGRCAANVWPKAPLTGRTVAAMAFSRLALLPPLLMCNVVTARRWNLPRLLASSDLAPALLISALAFTNGHMGSTCMMFGPSLVPLGKRAEVRNPTQNKRNRSSYATLLRLETFNSNQDPGTFSPWIQNLAASTQNLRNLYPMYT